MNTLSTNTILTALMFACLILLPFIVLFCLFAIEYFYKSNLLLSAAIKRAKAAKTVTVDTSKVETVTQTGPKPPRWSSLVTPSETNADKPTEKSISDRIVEFLKTSMKPLQTKDIADGLKLSSSYIEQVMKKKNDLFVRIDKEWGLKEWAAPS